MSEYSQKHRHAAKAKAKRLAGEHVGNVDASDYGAPSQEEFGQQTYVHKPKPPRAYKHGGKVEGEAARHHAGKRVRTGNKRPGNADGGEVPPTRFNFSGTEPGEMARAAGLKTGGRAERADGGKTDGDYKKPIGYHIIDNHTGDRVGKSRSLRGALNKVDRKDNDYGGYRHTAKALYEGDTYKRGGDAKRAERASGGRAKGKMNINIVIAQPHAGAAAPGMGEPPPAPHPAGMPVPAAAPAPMPPPGAMPGAPMGAAPPPPMPPQGGLGAGGHGFAGPLPRG